MAFQFDGYLEAVVEDLDNSNDFLLLMINKMIQTFEQSFLVEADSSNG